MDRVWRFLLVILMGLMLLLPGMALTIEIRDKELDRNQDAVKASYVLASLYDDPLFLESAGAGMGNMISFDEERLARRVRTLYGEEMEGFILVTEDYLRVDRGQGLGPPQFYRQVTGEACTWYRRDRDVCLLQGVGESYLDCDAEERDAIVYGYEDRLGLERAPMRAGLRIFLSQEVVLPWMGGQKGWKKQRECRIFLK